MSEDSVTKKMSAASFFNDNRAIAGFGNSMRAVFTSIRELVENGLDAAEKRGINPDIRIDLRKLSSREINTLLDVKQYKLEKHLDFLQLTCQDNGIGVPSNQIADLFGRVLTGTKYGVIQTRGRFGLGAKMCLLYSMSSVDLPAKIRTRYFMDDITHELHLMINLEKNEPIVMEQHEYLPGDPNYLEEPGTEISITFTGAWSRAKNSVKEYFRQLAIITPYSSFSVKLPGDKEGELEDFDFVNVVDDMPPPPQIVKIHPWGCDITQFKAELGATKSKNLKQFLATHFMGVNEDIAEGFFQLLEIDPNKSPKDITSHEIRRIVHEGFVKAYQEAKDVKRKRDRIFQFDDPKGTSLSPLGAARLRKGLEKELQPKFVEAVTRAPKAYSGHPFVVEVAIGYGGGVSEATSGRGTSIQDNKIIYRYANRIPLIFGAGNDVITHTVSSIRWNDYGLTRQSDPLAVAVSVVSTKIPFPETSKEYISVVPEIEEEIRLALMQLGRRLKTFLSRAKRRRREHARLSRFVRSAPIIVENLTKILEDEDLRFTDFRIETDRIAAALAHGSSKKVKLFMPIGSRLFGANVWCPTPIQTLLKANNIETVADFLVIPSKTLSTSLKLSPQEIYETKLRTISELDREKMSPEYDSKLFVSRTIEKRFTAQNGKSFVSLKDALYRRWIQNSYHYFATDYSKLRNVSGLLEKLFESKKEELLHQYLLSRPKKSSVSDMSAKRKQLIASITKAADLKLDTLFPTFEYLKDNAKDSLSRDTTADEFIFQTKMPFAVNYHPEITVVLINYLKNIFSQLCDKFPTYAKSPITKMKPDWTDAYTKNAFHRRKIKTIEDFISANIDDLSQIKELERVIYSSFLDILADSSTSVDVQQLELTQYEELKEDATAIKAALVQKKVKTLAQLLNVLSSSIYRKQYTSLCDLLLKESKYKLLKHIREAQKDKDISHIKIIPKEIEDNLNFHQIFTTTSFLAYPSPQLRKLGLKKKDVERIKKKLGTPIPSWLNLEEVLKTAGIVAIEELFYNPPEAYVLSAEMKKQYVEVSTFLRNPIIFAIPSFRRSSNLLREAGINCIGRFLIWSNSDLSEILGVNDERIKELKKSISYDEVKKNKSELMKDLSLVSKQFPRLVKYFDKHDMCLQDLYTLYPTEKPSLNSGYWKNIQNLTTLSNLEIFELSQLYANKPKVLNDLKEGLLRLKARHIVTLRQFLDLIPQIIETHLSVSKERKAVISLYNDIKNRNFTGESEFIKQILLVSEYDEFHRVFSLPISRISGLTLEEYDRLRNRGIIAIHQLFEYTATEIGSILGKTKEETESIINNFTTEQTGTPFFEKVGNKYESLISFEFEDSERFSSAEIVSLILSGFDTVDKIFYLAHPLTFASSIVNWNVIDKFRKLLRSPLTLVAWEKEIKKTVIDEETQQEKIVSEFQISTLTTAQLNALRSNGITKIIDLLVSKTEDISTSLEISIDEAKLLQKNIRISDTGIDLADLGILKPNLVRILDENNIVTIEDLYFSTAKEKWSVESIPWYIIASFKAILDLPLNHISDMLDPEIIDVLNKANINTLLGFMLTSPEILMDKTGIPDERFETIKSGLDLSDIFSYFSVPSYFLPDLSFIQTEMLRENGIQSVAEYITTSPQKLSKLLKNTPEENKSIISSLTTSSIQASYEQKGIFAFETKLFDKQEQRFLSRDSIFQFERFQTIQELYYATEEHFYHSNPDLWIKIAAVKNYLTLPLRIFTEISEFSLEVLEQNDIHYVYQLLFIPDADLTDPVLYRVVSNYSSRIIVMQAFHYFSKLPSTVYNATYFKRIVQNIENKSLSDVITDSKVIKDLMDKDRQYLTENYNLTLIRSILELPLRITPFFTRIRKARRDEYKNVMIGDVFEIDLEEHSALSPFYSKLLDVDSLDKLIMELSIPIASMGLPKNLALRLSKSAVNTLIDFFSTTEKQISEISGFSQKMIREIKENLTYSDIIAFRLSQAHAIRPAKLITEKQVDDLKDIGISDIESFFYSANIMGISDILKIEDYKKIRELLSGSIRFVGFLSFAEVKKLEFNNINSVIDLALLNKEELFEVTQNPIYKEFHVLDLISFDELAERRIQSAIPLTVCPSIEEDYMEKLTDIGINSVQDFISRMEEIRESRPALVKLDIFREVQLYKASVAFIGLDNNQIQQLIYSGVSDILSFITEDISTIALILKTPEKKVLSYLETITPPNLASEVQRKGVKIEEFTVLSKGRINSLLRSGVEYVQDLYSQHYQAYPTFNVSEEYMSDFLNSCNISVFRIKELTAEEKLSLTRDGIIRLIDLFNCSDKDLKKALGRIPKRIGKIRKGEFTLTRGAKLVLNEPLVDLLKSLNFDPTKKAVEDLFGYIPESLLQFSETQRIEKSSSIVFIEQLISFLCLNILPLPWFEITTKAVLWNNGIKHVIELISANVEDLKGVSKEVIKEIRQFQREFNVTKNMSEIFSHYIDHSLAFPNNAEKQFMKFGLSSALLLVDFIPHPLFEFQDIEKSIIRITTSNMFKPLTWMVTDLQLEVTQLLPLIKSGGTNIVSSLLLLSKSERTHEIYAKINEVLNKKIIQLKPPEWGIKLADTKIISDLSLAKKLKSEKIIYLDEFLALDSKIAENKDLVPLVYPILLSLKSLTLSSLDNLPSKAIEKLKRNGVKNLYEFLALPSPMISKIIGETEDNITYSKTSIDLKLLEEKVKLTGLDITLVPGLSKEAKETLSQYGCVSLVQAINLNLELLPLSNEDRVHLMKSKSILLTPITLIAKSLNLKDKEIFDLLKRGITTYTDLLELPEKNQTPSVKKLLAQQKEEPNFLAKNLNNIKKQGIKIEDFGLSQSITNQLLEIGATTIEHLYFLPEDYIIDYSKIKKEDLDEIRNKLSLSINYLPNLTKETIAICFEKGFDSIINHIIFLKQFPKAIRDEILNSISQVKRIKVENLQEQPIRLLLPSNITIKSWLNLQNAVKTVEELYLLSDKELAQILSIDQAEVDKLRYSISKDSFADYPRIKENKIISESDVEFLNKEGIKNYTQLFDAQSSQLPEEINDKIQFIKNLNIKDLEPSLEDSVSLEDFIYINMNLDNFDLSKKQSILLHKLSDFIFSKGKTLTQILELESREKKLKLSDMPFEFLLLLEKHQKELYTKTLSTLHSKLKKQVKQLIKYIPRSTILLLPQRNKIDLIAKETPSSIGDLLLEDYDAIRAKVQETEFLRNLRNLSLQLLMKLEDGLTALPQQMLSESNLTLFSRHSILSVEEAICFNIQSKNKTTNIWKSTNMLRNLVETDLFTLQPITQNKQIYKKLTNLKMNSIYDLLQYCKTIDEDKDVLNCTQLLPKLAVTKVEKMLGTEQKRFSSFLKETNLSPFLHKKNIRTIGALVKHIENTDITDLESAFGEILSSLRTPMNALTNHARLLEKMENSGLIQVSDYVLASDVRNTIKEPLTENEQTIIKNLSASMSINEINVTVSKKSYSVQKVGLFDDSIKKLLKQSGYNTVAHLKLPSELIADTSKLNNLQLTRLHNVLANPVYVLNELISSDVKCLFKLYNDNILTLWDLFATTPQALSKKCGIPIKELRKYISKINQQEIKNSSKDLVLFKNTHPFLNEEIISKLEGAGINSLQELLFPNRELKTNIIFKEIAVKNLLKFLDRKIDDLEIAPKVLDQIKQLGISFIKDFVIYPAAAMDEKTDLSYLSIKNHKNKLTLAKQKPKAATSTKAKTKSKTTTKPKPTTKPKATTNPKKTTQKTNSSSAKKPARARQTTLMDLSKNPPKKTTPGNKKEVDKK